MNKYVLLQAGDEIEWSDDIEELIESVELELLEKCDYTVLDTETGDERRIVLNCFLLPTE